ncbi:MAG: hypothetical protein HYV97_14125 [Bdellovibrio sp.]|nr:hypothetical protein [Bdellovibrio sp.]
MKSIYFITLMAIFLVANSLLASEAGKDFFSGIDIFKGVTKEQSIETYREVECYQRGAYKRCPTKICQKIWLNQGLKLMSTYKNKYGQEAFIEATGGKSGQKISCK